MSRAEAQPAARPQRVDVVAVAVYLLVAFGAAWLVALPLWTSGRGLQTPGAVFLMAAMMAAPILGVLVVVGWTGWVVMALGLAVVALVVRRRRETSGPGGPGPAPLPAGRARRAS